MFVLTADQRGSRTDRDRVPEILARGRMPGMLRAFERTAGDEVQAVFDGAEQVASTALDLADSGSWSVGIGVGAVEDPLPDQTRAGRGEAFVSARDAVESAKRNRWHLSVFGESEWCGHAQTAAWLLLDLLADRSDAGREAVRLVAEGMTQSAAAGLLNISPQAMSLRVRHARWDVQQPAEDLLVRLLRCADGGIA
ncbi:hypothetical protein [Gordonia neofelifaecis]|uniref:DNA-binding protein n=1 Tax=Gordonia neofelifaecis NRRL B-59395 TaxID=644548 RepID=F1YG33_9ACTN|nr:hypothetical protein [Gordonia neofelifaecis]EGD56156.1 hypothetical protein SCNU_04841 [Gordonia neofelifaecis NRRL B-59395]